MNVACVGFLELHHNLGLGALETFHIWMKVTVTLLSPNPNDPEISPYQGK
jgi:hypothetical protein